MGEPAKTPYIVHKRQTCRRRLTISQGGSQFRKKDIPELLHLLNFNVEGLQDQPILHVRARRHPGLELYTDANIPTVPFNWTRQSLGTDQGVFAAIRLRIKSVAPVSCNELGSSRLVRQYVLYLCRLDWHSITIFPKAMRHIVTINLHVGRGAVACTSSCCSEP